MIVRGAKWWVARYAPGVWTARLGHYEVGWIQGRWSLWTHAYGVGSQRDLTRRRLWR